MPKVPPIYKPVAHTAPHTATVDNLTIKGQGPGMILAQINSMSNPFFVATKLDPIDGQPTGMVAIDPKSVGTVS